MNRRVNRRVGSFVGAGWLGVLLAAVVACTAGFAQEAGKPKAAAGEKKPAANARAKPKGRLPAYYAKVVDEKQRAAIYDLQAAFAAKREVLEKQLAALKSEEEAAIEAVLTPQQKQKLAALREEAKAAREKRAAAKKAADEQQANEAGEEAASE